MTHANDIVTCVTFVKYETPMTCVTLSLKIMGHTMVPKVQKNVEKIVNWGIT